MQHAAVAQNLAEEVAKVADQLKDFELRAISAAGRGLTSRADAALESRREWPPARVQPELILQFLTSPDVASGLRVCVRWSESAEAACRLVALRSRAQELAAAIDPDYMQRHPALTWEMRKSLVDWIAAVHHSRRFSPEVLFLAVRIIDEYLAVAEPVLQPNLQLVGVAALALACFRESDSHIVLHALHLHEIALSADNAYDGPTILAMEKTISQALADGNTTYASSSVRTVMMSYLKAENSDEDCYMVWIASCVAERMLLEHKMLKYLPSMVAACAVYVARGSLDKTAWTNTLQRCSQYSADDLRACLEDVKQFMVVHRRSPETANEFIVYIKYRNRRLGAPAMIPLRIDEWSYNPPLDLEVPPDYDKPPLLYPVSANRAELEMYSRLPVPRMRPRPGRRGVTPTAPREPQEDSGSCATM